ncbi:hypothetical protein D3C87_1744050 [compost metagenome]
MSTALTLIVNVVVSVDPEDPPIFSKPTTRSSVNDFEQSVEGFESAFAQRAPHGTETDRTPPE